MLRQSDRSDGRRIGNEYEIIKRDDDGNKTVRCARAHTGTGTGSDNARVIVTSRRSVLVERWWRVATKPPSARNGSRCSLAPRPACRRGRGRNYASLSMVRFTRRRRPMREVRGRSERKTLNAKNNYREDVLINVEKNNNIIIF